MGTANGQSKQMLLHVQHGKVRYLSLGQWNYISTSKCLDDTCWIEDMDENGSYMLVMDKLCSEITGKCFKQAKANVFDICDTSRGDVMDILHTIYKNSQ